MYYRSLFTLASATGLVPAAFGGYIHVSDFSGANIGDPLGAFAPVPGIDGWIQSEGYNDPDGDPDTTFPGVEGDAPLSWISNHAGQNAGTIGTYYDVPLGSSYYVSHAISAPLVGSSLGMRFGIQDSTTDFPTRNQFYISLVGASNANLFTLFFTPTDQTVDFDDPLDPTDPGTAFTQWDMNWTSGAYSDPEFQGVIEDSSYTLDLTFVLDGLDVKFTAYFDGPLNDFTETGTLSGLNLTTESITELRVGTIMDGGGGATDWGDNFFAFAAIPEPSSPVLLGLAALGLVVRRRR